jgi:hypothetical protein
MPDKITVLLTEADWQLIIQEGDARTEMHKDDASCKPASADRDRIGLAGEYAFSKLTGLPLDWSRRRNGDGGVDFHSNMGTIDIKTARIATYLFL